MFITAVSAYLLPCLFNMPTLSAIGAACGRSREGDGSDVIFYSEICYETTNNTKVCISATILLRNQLFGAISILFYSLSTLPVAFPVISAPLQVYHHVGGSTLNAGVCSVLGDARNGGGCFSFILSSRFKAKSTSRCYLWPINAECSIFCTAMLAAFYYILY